MSGFAAARPESAGLRSDAVFALSGYPVSDRFLERVGLAGIRPVLLSHLREQGLVAMVRGLRRVRAARGIAVMEDEGSAPFAPLLYSLLLFTQCATLQLAAPSGELQALSRGQLWRSLIQTMIGTLAGPPAVLRQLVTAFRLNRARRQGVSAQALRGRWLYLKVSLWFGVRVGGSIGHVAGVINALHRSSTPLEILAGERPPMVDPDIPFVPLPTLERLGFPYEFNNYRLDQLIARFATRRATTSAPAVIYHRLSLGSLAAVLLARKERAALVFEYNGSEAWVARHWGRGIKLYRLARLCEDICLRQAHGIVVVSDVLREECVARGIPADRVFVQPNGIDPAVFDPSRFPPEKLRALRLALGIPADAVVLTFLGTYGMWHGAEVFAAAARRLIVDRRTGDGARPLFFLFVGDGLRMGAVRAAFADLPGEVPVRYTGLVPQDRAPEYLAASDILVSPHIRNADGTRFFGSPTKLFEYMAMGKAIAASDLEQIGEVLANSLRSDALPDGPPRAGEDRLAVLSPPGDVDALEKSLRFLAARPDYRAVLGSNARREALARYTWQAAVEHMMRALPKAFES